MKVYLAGPMRGYPEFNFPAFHAAATALRAGGHEVFSPAEHDLNNGFDPTGMRGDHAELTPAGFNLREALATDLDYVCREAEAVVLLPGWEQSNGARAEAFAACAIGIPVWSYQEVRTTTGTVRAAFSIPVWPGNETPAEGVKAAA